MVALEDCCQVIWAFLLPPVAVFMETGCSAELCLNILLTLFLFIPGVIHAFFVIMECGREEHSDWRRRHKGGHSDAKHMAYVTSV